ncbi:MAG: Tn3 family transposase [Deltaproteobacteria bacterium]|nr:Tn3 family transposase [Deltaproteobacteria bacterium]
MHRSLYLLDYIDCPPLRQHMQKALNLGENYYQLCRAISYAGFGKLRFKTKYEQELWAQWSRRIANCTIFYNASVLSRLLEHQERPGIHRVRRQPKKFARLPGSTSISRDAMSFRSNQTCSISTRSSTNCQRRSRGARLLYPLKSGMLVFGGDMPKPQVGMSCNSGRSETLLRRPKRLSPETLTVFSVRLCLKTLNETEGVLSSASCD